MKFSSLFPLWVLLTRPHSELVRTQRRVAGFSRLFQLRKSRFDALNTSPCRSVSSTMATVKHSTSSSSSAEIRSAFRPPDDVEGMTELDPSRFTAEFQIPMLNLTFEEFQNDALKAELRSVSLKVPGIANVQDACSTQMSTMNCSFFKKILLRPDKIRSFGDLPERFMVAVTSKHLVFETLRLTYDNWSVADVLNAILPSQSELNSTNVDADDGEDEHARVLQRSEHDKISGWSFIGHILHLNLRESNLPYKHIIGQVLLDKHRKFVRTVVNKTQNIDSQYRFFQMELLAGEPDYVVDVKENRAKYKFDFSKVYWNPRLSSEHERLVNIICKKPDAAAAAVPLSSPTTTRTVVFDLFAGVGPFVIPLAKKLPSTSKIYANDLNPECVRWLRINAEMNKIDPNILDCYDSMDAGDVLQKIMPTLLKQFIHNSEACRDDENDGSCDSHFYTVHFIMNLPATAYTFLDRFVGVLPFRDAGDASADDTEYVQALEDGRIKFIVHLYYFNKLEFDSIDKRINSRLGTNFTLDELKPVFVRNVAPNKDMLRVTFELPSDVMLRRQTNADTVMLAGDETGESSRRLKRTAENDFSASVDDDNFDTSLTRAAKNFKLSNEPI